MFVLIKGNFLFCYISKIRQKAKIGPTNFSIKEIFNYAKKKLINRKFRLPRKQGAHFLGAGAQIQDSWVFHHQHEISDR
jgi:hypothetical protein